MRTEVYPDRMHMLVEIPPKLSVSSFHGVLEGKEHYGQFGELKHKYRSRELWCRRYYVDTAGKNASRTAEYMANQLKKDELGEQLTMSELSPFTGGKLQSERGWQTIFTYLTCMRVTRGLARL